MALDIWFYEDIRNALLAANEASSATAAVIAETGAADEDANELLIMCMRVYRQGYRAALATVALSFGLSPQSIAAGEEAKRIER